MNKLVPIDELVKIRKDLKDKGKTVALLHGCFDVLHIGHLTLFEEAKKLADILVLGVLNDALLSHYKGINRPLFPLEQRVRMLSHVDFIDYIFELPILPTNEEQIDREHDELYVKLQPDIVVSAEGDKESAFKRDRCAKLNLSYRGVQSLI